MPNVRPFTHWRSWLLVCCYGAAGLCGQAAWTQTQAAEPFPEEMNAAEVDVSSSLQGFHSHGSADLWQAINEVESAAKTPAEEVKAESTPKETKPTTGANETAAPFPQSVSAKDDTTPQGTSSAPNPGRSGITLLGSETPDPDGWHQAAEDNAILQVGHNDGPTLIPSPERLQPVPQRQYVPDPFRMTQVPAPAPPPTPPPAAPPSKVTAPQTAPATSPAPAPMPEPLFSPEVTPEPLPYDGYIPIDEPAQPMFESVLGIDDGVHYFPQPTEIFVDGGHVEDRHVKDVRKCCDPCSPWYKIFRPFCSHPGPDQGIGHERVMYAPFFIEPALPQNFTGLRFESGTDLYYPDRSELFWAGGGRGPALPEVEVDYSEVILTLASGSDTFSATTEIPIRYVDPVVNQNTSGLGDISMATKLVMINGDRWTLTQYFKTTLATGSKTRGLGVGHISLEPGFLASMRWTDRTYLFGDIRYQFPIGGNKQYAGQLLQYGLGLSTIGYETDAFAILPTFEVTGWSAQGGSKTSPLGVVLGVGGETSPIVTHGLRFVLGPAGDLGLFEFGISSSYALNNEGPFSALGQIDMRFVY
ncbi:hypothetical protein [Rubinisphaera sp. JC750]|uniref:hypothetical protein n=1 Tax=Rubinisphaera sp. JC750 TaxID=2898658 RepID=UPI001F1927B9|nr:hypothetical protein [Rubinisphaera sp. JC750]